MERIQRCQTLLEAIRQFTLLRDSTYLLTRLSNQDIFEIPVCEYTVIKGVCCELANHKLLRDCTKDYDGYVAAMEAFKIVDEWFREDIAAFDKKVHDRFSMCGTAIHYTLMALKEELWREVAYI